MSVVPATVCTCTRSGDVGDGLILDVDCPAFDIHVRGLLST